MWKDNVMEFLAWPVQEKLFQRLFCITGLDEDEVDVNMDNSTDNSSDISEEDYSSSSSVSVIYDYWQNN